jgi:hypothetical protein
MGNGALPHGPSYRAHPRLYLGVFHCGAQNLDAIGGTTDIDWPLAPIASEANDPSRKCCVRRSTRDNVDISECGEQISVPPQPSAAPSGGRSRCRFQPLSKYSFEPVQYCLPNLGRTCSGASSSHFSAAQQPRGLDRRARAPPSSSVRPCRGSVAAPPSASRRSAIASPRDFHSNPAAERSPSP